MQAGQDTEPGGPHGDGRITRSPAAGAAAAMLSACARPSRCGPVAARRPVSRASRRNGGNRRARRPPRDSFARLGSRSR